MHTGESGPGRWVGEPGCCTGLRREVRWCGRWSYIPCEDGFDSLRDDYYSDAGFALSETGIGVSFGRNS